MYVFGGMYGPDKDKQTFELVGPSKGLPYVYNQVDEAQNAFKLVEHHAHLYELNTEFWTVGLFIRGDTRAGAARLYVELRSDQIESLRASILEKGKNPLDDPRNGNREDYNPY